MIEQHNIELIASAVVAFETSQNPDEVSRQYVAKVTQAANKLQLVDEPIRQRAVKLESEGFKALDALHVACAEAAGADYFITCDDRLVRRYRRSIGATLITCDPTEFIRLMSNA